MILPCGINLSNRRMSESGKNSGGVNEWLAVADSSSGDVGNAPKSELPKASAACIPLSLGSLKFFQIQGLGSAKPGS
ncbi:hypothetical protein McaMca56_007791 [Microsporum canis]